MADFINLFAGAGGWEVGARDLGLRGIGVEWMPEACETLAAANFNHWCADIRDLKPLDYESSGVGFIASPPCQTFSAAGKGAGRREFGLVLEALRVWSWEGDFADERTGLILDPLRWMLAAVAANRPYPWIAMEQVPTCLPVWEGYAVILRDLGYSVDVGILNAEMFGVPQTRKRAVLVARLEGEARLPSPTHSRYYINEPNRLDEGVLPWISMAEALDWTHGETVISNYGTGGDAAKRGERGGGEPSATITSKAGRNRVIYRNGLPNRNATRRELDTPAPTFAFDKDQASCGWESEYGARSEPGFSRITVEQAGILQTFPADYPWRGSKTSQFIQVGNAVPPVLARAVLARLVNPMEF